MTPSQRSIITHSRASILQEGLWLSPYAAAHPANCNLLWSIRIAGACSVSLIAEKLNLLLERHAALRSVFHWEHDGLRARITPPTPVALHVTPEPFDRESFGLAPFDLVQGPLYRFKLLRRSDLEHELLCGFHHLVVDGLSWPKLVSEFAQLLSDLDLPEAGAGYESHVAWQNEQLAGPHAETSRAFWREKLDALPAPWEMPQLEGNASGGEIDVMHLSLSEDLSEQLRASARALGSTPFRLAMAVLIALLSRLARRDDVVLATTLAGRSAPGSRDTVGFFAHTGLVQAEVPGGASLATLLTQVNAQLDDLLRHEALPIRVAARDLSGRFDHSRNPLTAVSFTRLPARIHLTLGDLAITEERIFLPLSERDVAIYFQPNGTLFDIIWIFRSSAMSTSPVRALHQQFCSLLRAALTAPEGALADVDTLPEDDRRQILGKWNATAVPFPAMAPLHRLFEAQARRTPDAIAVTNPERSWTYSELEGAANRLAAKLLEYGVMPGSFVILRMNPNFVMIAAELAVMKCGCAFVPIGTEWPASRIAAVADRIGGTPLLLGDTGQADEIQVQPLLTGTEDPGAPTIHTGLDDPIYCIFTSGSTGRPKGAVNPHRGVANRLFAMNEAFGVPAGDTILVTAPATVDTHVWQFFWPLSFGGRVVVAPRELVVTPARMFDLVAKAQVTVLDFVPSLFAEVVALLRERGAAGLVTVRLLLLGGEAMRARDAYDFRTLLPLCRVVNTYGPTETAIGVIFGDLPAEYVASIPLGRPYANVQAVILQGNRLAPTGVAGELCLGGACVGLGYLNDQQETARVFVTNPFPEITSERLYRTGDLARMRADGVVEFLGRIDHQIKIRGVRIEPAEVEAVLARHPSVSAAVAAVSSRASASHRLVAHFTLADGHDLPSLRDFRHHMLRELPVQMVPEAFIQHDAFPLLANGKIDRATLLVSTGKPLVGLVVYEPPQGPVEQRLAAIWQDLLNCGAVSRCDSFFQTLGGDSLQAMRLILRIQECFGVLVDLRLVYETADLKELAAALAEASTQAKGARPALAMPSNLIPLRAHGTKVPLVLVHGWGGHISHFDGIEQRIDEDRPVYGVWCSPEDAKLLPSPSVETLADRYAAQILARFPDGVHLAGYSAGGWYAHAVGNALLKGGGSVGAFILLDVQVTSLMLDPAVRCRVRLYRRIRLARDRLRVLRRGEALDGRMRYALRVVSGFCRRIWSRAVRATSRSTGPDPSEETDYFMRLLSSYSPPRTALNALVVGPRSDRNVLEAIWMHYTTGRMSFLPLFNKHHDFRDADLMPRLSEFVGTVLTRTEDRKL